MHAATRRRLVYGAAALLALACSGSITDLSPAPGTVNSIAIIPPTATLALGDQVPFQAVATDADGKVVASSDILWTVRDTAIASVSASGVVSARSLGSTQVAASANGHSAVAAITVATAVVASVVVTPPSVSAPVGTKAQFTAVTLDASERPLSGRAIAWTSTNESVATVDANGNMTAVSVGTASITAASEGKSASAAVTVTRASVASVSVKPNPLSMSVGQSTPLGVVATDSAGDAVTGLPTTWSTSDQSIATVSATGVLTAVAAGSVQITATVGGKSGTANVTVSNFAVGSVTVQPRLDTIADNSSVQLTPVVLDVTGAATTGRVVTWSSSNAAVATVSSDGLVAGVTPGTVTITATSEGKSGAAAVTVTTGPVATVIVPATATLTVGQADTLVATLKDAAGATVTNSAVTWTGNNNAAATVSSTGIVTAVAQGTATITAASEGKTGSTVVTVNPPAAVASVTVAPLTISIVVNQSTPFSATLKDAAGNVLTGRTVTWSSSPSTVATVSATGVVTGVAPGTATITATSGTVSGSGTVTIALVPVATITLAPSSKSIVVGNTLQLADTLKDAAGNVLTGRAVTWSSNTPTVATVSTTGLVTAVGAGGPATITATSGAASGTAAITVTLVPVATVAVAPTTASIVVGSTLQLTDTLKDAAGNILTGRTVTWTSGTPAVATVSTTGLVTAVTAGGPVTITATSGSASATAAVTVTLVPVATVAVAPTTASIVVGTTLQLTDTLKDAAGNILTGRAVTWSSNAPTVATVSTAGLVTAVGAGGPATITATSGGASGTAAITVTLAPVATVAVAPTSASLVVNATLQLTDTLKDASGNILTGRAVTWTSNTPTVATVSTTGLVTAVGAGGPATITATSGSASGTAAITVTDPVVSITLAPPAPNIVTGQTVTLVPTLKDANNKVVTGRTVTWKTSDATIASVDASGIVTGVDSGSVTITATVDAASATATVTVTLAPVATVIVTPATDTVAVGSTIPLTVTLEDANGKVLTGRVVTWTSSDNAKATVAADGTVTGVAASPSVMIKATSEGKSGSSNVTVTP